MSQLIVADSSVLFHFSIKLEDGSVADSTALHGKPARLRMGDGSLTPSFEQCLLGLREGESKPADIHRHVDAWIKAHQKTFDAWIVQAKAAALKS